MEYVYHGSKIKNLKTIEPQVSTHKQKLIYATKSPCIATIFLSTEGCDLLYALGGEGTKEKPAYLVERIPKIFDKIFTGEGSIYTLNAQPFYHKEGLWLAELVTENSQKVLNEEIISNILERLEKYQEEGILNLYRYPNRPDFIPLDNSDLIDKYITFYNMGHSDSIKRLLLLYPDFKNKVNNRLKNNEQKKLNN